MTSHFIFNKFIVQIYLYELFISPVIYILKKS